MEIIKVIIIFIGLIVTVSDPEAKSSLPNKQQVVQQSAVSSQNATSQGLGISTNIETRIDRLENRVNSEIKAAELRFEAMATSTERSFNIIIWVSAIIGVTGTILGIVVLVINWMREQEHRKVYENERKFYEERLIKSDKLEQKTMENEFANIEKINNVIKLIEHVYSKQEEREETLGKIEDELRGMGKVLSGFTGHFKEQYKEATRLILTFKDYSRLKWTNLNLSEVSIANRARTIFETLPTIEIKENEDKKPFEHARNLQLLGVSAYYANDIEYAIKYLEKAKALFANDFSDEYLYSCAFSLHFLGIIDKNWKREGVDIGTSLSSAVENLGKANYLLKNETEEFLTPLTYAEVCSYLDSYREESETRLKELINTFEGKKESLNENQKALLTRAYLIRGNLDYLNKDYSLALEWYDKAILYSDNHFAYLSKALVTKDHKERNNLFFDGLDRLENSGALNKTELTVRLTSIAWAIIASSEINDDKKISKYTKDLHDSGQNIRTVAHRQPLFFSPLEKLPVEYGVLEKTVSDHIHASVIARCKDNI